MGIIVFLVLLILWVILKIINTLFSDKGIIVHTIDKITGRNLSGGWIMLLMFITMWFLRIVVVL